MSFFDEVETTVANTRFLQAIEDNGPIVLNFKQPVQLADVEAFIRPRINIDLLLKPQTTAQYLFKQYLCTQKDEDAVHLLTHIENFRKIGGGPRRQLATKLLQDHAPLTGAGAASASSSTPGAAYVVPNESDTINPPQTLAPATSSSSAPASPTSSPAPLAVLPCLEHVLAKSPPNHSTCTAIRNTAAKELEAIQATLAQPGPPSVTLFDDLSQSLSRVLEEKVAGFLRSAFFKRYVQLEDYSTREVHLKDFRIFRVLGRGAFGAVSAVQKIDTHAVYAMKEMSMKQVKQDQSEWMVINERKVLAKMNSPFVLGLKYSFHEEETLYLIFDMCAGGDLKFHLRNAKDKCFDAARAKFYAAEVLLGLQHIHEHDIVYRDLKPNNILLNQNGHVIISDLGLTIKLRKNKVLKHLAGTAGYWSPEIISKSGTYKTSDYWSFGVMLYEMLLGKRPQCSCDKKSKEWCPFGQKKNMEDNALDPAGVLKLDIEYPPDKINAVAKDFLSKLFIVDPLARLGANGIAEIKSHPYFADIDWEALACMEVVPPYVPDPRTVNANSIGEVGEFNTNQHKNIQLTADDYKMYEGFRHTSLEGVQIELVEALTKMDNPDSKNNPANASVKEEGTGSCCIIL